jgi:triosephosphate isomerase
MSSRKPFVAGNWKMNLLRAEARALAGAVARAAARRPDVDCGVFPAFTSLDMVRVALEGTRVILGGQACHASSRGAHTGEISAPMLVDAGCRAVLCGHSERRAAGESDAAVGASALAAVSVGLRAVVCVGETLAEREAGRTREVVARQLDAVLARGGIGDAVVAYEPVWAIGTGRTASPEQAQEVHGLLRKRLSETTLLYGGSVKPDNAAAIFAMPDVDGGLIGGAALKAQDFIAICKEAQRKG